MSTLRINDLRKSAEGFSARATVQPTEFDEVVRSIIAAIKQGGDTALTEMAERLDDLNGRPLRVTAEELKAAAEQLTPEFRAAFDLAVANIREFALRQLPKECFDEFSPGRKLGWIVRPLEAVGCYVPSGRYPLPSTLLMTAVLAQTVRRSAYLRQFTAAIDRDTRLCSSAGHSRGISDWGAHAIAAMAIGTTAVARVQRIVGPGNAYVAAAKKLLAGEVGIDFVAGPTEITIIAQEGDARSIAADMLAQAEHDTAASAVLITTSAELAEAVAKQVERQLETLPTAEVARQAIAQNSYIYLVNSMEAAVDLCNEIAPEHLSLHDPSLLPGIRNAGTVFLGPHSPESAGDYAAGPSHVLPTGGASRLRGGLSAADFVKVIAIQELSASALDQLAPAITTLARAEGLEAHARAVEVRSVR